MNDLVVAQLTSKDAAALSRLLTADDHEYRQYFTPFSTDILSIEKRLSSTREDRYWGFWFGGMLTGFFMLRGLAEGNRRPSFGVYIAGAYSGKGLSTLALGYLMTWCRLNGINALMLKVHPDNRYARQTYEKAGFKFIELCSHSGHYVMEKRWDQGK